MIAYIEEGAIAPVLAATYALEDLHAAQTAFIEKMHTGNIVVWRPERAKPLLTSEIAWHS